MSSWSDPRYHLNTIDLRDPGEVSEVRHGAVGRSVPDVTVADPTLGFADSVRPLGPVFQDEV